MLEESGMQCFKKPQKSFNIHLPSLFSYVICRNLCICKNQNKKFFDEEKVFIGEFFWLKKFWQKKCYKIL